MTALVFLVLMGVASIPVVGGLGVYVLSPFLVAGYFAAARAGESGEPVTFLYLGTGFRQAGKGLFVIGLAYLLTTLFIFKIVLTLTGGNLQTIVENAQSPASMDPAATERMLREDLPALSLGMLMFIPLLMATWFSPGLVLFEGFGPAKAMWWSPWACAVNWRPLVFYTLIVVLVGMVAIVIPLGLGLLVFLPWTLTSTFAAYRQIFVSGENPDPPHPVLHGDNTPDA